MSSAVCSKAISRPSIGFDDERIVTNMMGTLVGGIETTNAAIVQLLEQLFKRQKILQGGHRGRQ